MNCQDFLGLATVLSLPFSAAVKVNTEQKNRTYWRFLRNFLAVLKIFSGSTLAFHGLAPFSTQQLNSIFLLVHSLSKLCSQRADSVALHYTLIWKHKIFPPELKYPFHVYRSLLDGKLLPSEIEVWLFFKNWNYQEVTVQEAIQNSNIGKLFT